MVEPAEAAQRLLDRRFRRPLDRCSYRLNPVVCESGILSRMATALLRDVPCLDALKTPIRVELCWRPASTGRPAESPRFGAVGPDQCKRATSSSSVMTELLGHSLHRRGGFERAMVA
jgi:hypothetical protein